MAIKGKSVGTKSSMPVAKKMQPSAKHTVAKSDLPLEHTIMMRLGEAHSLGIPLSQEHLCILGGYGHPKTKAYAAAFKKNRGDKLLAVNGGNVDLTPEGMEYLTNHGALPPSPPSNEDAASRIKTLLEKFGLETTGFDILDVLAYRESGLAKVELAKKVNKASTTKSFSGSLTFLAALGILKKYQQSYEITSVYRPFPTV